jgi:hypothetical protein
MDETPLEPRTEQEQLQEEVERLRRRVADLEKEVEERKKGRTFFKPRALAAWALIVLFFVTVLFSPAAVWAHETLLDTDAFVNTVAPLAGDEAVARAVGDKAAEALMSGLDVEGNLESVLPEDITFLAAPLTTVLQDMASKTAEEVLRSSSFLYIWEKILRFAHSTAVQVITGEKVLRVTVQGDVELDLTDLLQQVKEKLVENGLDFLEGVELPEDAGRVVLFTSKELGIAKEGVDALNTLNWFLPLMALLFLAGAILVSDDRRKFILIAGVALALAMAVLLVVLDVAKSDLLNKVPEADLAAAEVVWNTVTGGLAAAAYGLLALGVVTAAGAALAGPSRWAAWLRARAADLFAGWRERRRKGAEKPGPVGGFVQVHRMAFRVSGLAAAVIVLLAVSRVTVGLVVVTTLGLVVYLVIIELVRSGPFEKEEKDSAEEGGDEE